MSDEVKVPAKANQQKSVFDNGCLFLDTVE